jgi:tetratricopeptide (TPR) repeat protein
VRFTVLLVTAIAVAAAGCNRGRGPASPHAAVQDAPYELDDDLDLAEQTDRLAAAPAGEPRDALRREVAAALVRRLDHQLARNRLDRVDIVVRQLVLLWQEDPAAMAGDLAGDLPSLRKARAALARAGLDRETALVLAILAVADTAHTAAHRDELEQVVEYAENLGVARMGPLGLGSGTIHVLEPIVTRAPASPLTDRYVGALVARANLADAALTAAAASGKLPDSPAIRVAFRAGRDIAVALAIAHRSDEIGRTVAGLAGVGRIRTLEEAARDAAGADATAVEWAALARALRQGHDGKDDDPGAARAALTVCLDALVRFPDNPLLLGAAAGHAYDLDRLDQPIALLERARAADPRDAELADRLTSHYRERLGRLTHGDRPHAARARLEELRRFYAEIDGAFPDHQWSSTWAEALAAYGRGLAAVGELAAARSELDRSVRLAPNIEALETLGTIALKLGEFDVARRHLERGAGLGGDEPAAQYQRAKLLRLAGDAARGAGDSASAMRRWHEALEIWARLGETVDLPPHLAGERFAEIGKLFWGLGMRDEALENFARAIEADPGGAESHVQIIAYMIMQDEVDRARDVFYDALGSDRVSDYHKVYLCLWIVAEDRRNGRPDDRLASEYLAGRDGPLWYDDVARLATGRATVEALDARATTRARRAELTYYRAVLGPAAQDPGEVRRLLEDVVRTDMVLFFEYDMARRQLRR